jgi:hypothetical protein
MIVDIDVNVQPPIVCSSIDENGKRTDLYFKAEALLAMREITDRLLDWGTQYAEIYAGLEPRKDGYETVISLKDWGKLYETMCNEAPPFLSDLLEKQKTDILAKQTPRQAAEQLHTMLAEAIKHYQELWRSIRLRT